MAATNAVRGDLLILRRPQSEAAADRSERASRLEIRRGAFGAPQQRAFDALTKLARRDPRARRAIAEWTESEDRELAWTARLLHREVHQRNVLRFQNFPQAFRVGPQAGVTLDFDDLERRLRDFDQMFGQMGAGVDEVLRSLGVDPSGQTFQNSQGQSYSLQAGPDGIVLEMTEDVDGQKQRQQVMPTRSYLSQVELTLTFGLGEATQASAVRVRWPGATEWQDVGALEGGKTHVLTQ